MDIKNNINNIKNEIGLSSTFKLFNPKIKVIAVSKYHSIEQIEQAIKYGIDNFAENYVQEAKHKWVFLKQKYPNIKLHLIGHLQSNKVNKALELFDCIQTLDSLKLAKEISKKIQKNTPITKDFYIQINLGNAEQRNGISPKELPFFIDECKKLSLNISGLMTILPTTTLAYPYFAFMYKLKNQFNLEELSMGMSNDYKNAIRFGSTQLRIGTAIFGERKL
jgi:pyridoxal phosphate enzyme (YggS family)